MSVAPSSTSTPTPELRGLAISLIRALEDALDAVISPRFSHVDSGHGRLDLEVVVAGRTSPADLVRAVETWRDGGPLAGRLEVNAG